MLPLAFHRVVVRHRIAALDRALRGDGAAGVEQGFEQRSLAGASVAHEGDVANLGGGIGGHERVSLTW